MSNSESKKILLLVNGSIAAFKAVSLCSKLVQLGHQIEVVLSDGAEKFVGAASFEGFTRRPVHSGLYDSGRMMAHIDLERWADVILLYPASANMIAKLANGMADSLISAIALAHEFKKTFWIAPAMNQAMWTNPATQENLKRLSGWGYRILTPDSGFLACGETGAGRLIEPEIILDMIQTHHAPLNRKKILITSGGTVEPIDAVRSITNFSTGETGYRMAKSLKEAGHSVTLIQSKHSKFEMGDQLNYSTTTEFTECVKQTLSTQSFDYLIHAAAVADFHVVNPPAMKQESVKSLMLELKPNAKVIQSVRGWSRNPNLQVISFKLTANSEMKLDAYDSEWIIHNELNQVNREHHHGTIYDRDRNPIKIFQTKNELAQSIRSIIEGVQP